MGEAMSTGHRGLMVRSEVLSRCAGAAQYIWGDWYVQYIVTPYLSETKVILAPPPPSKRGGEGVRGREEDSAF